MKFLLKSLAIWLLSIAISYAEVVLDGSVGPKKSIDLKNDVFDIDAELGQQHGGNLFHSFDSFDLKEGQTANFTNLIPTDPINNIISRVTGGKSSQIDGTISSKIDANFYLLNPNGIMFGKNARLDVQGSFYASTADYLKSKEGEIFYVNNSENLSFITESPHSFGFLDNNLASINVNGSKLEITGDNNLSIISGDLNIDNGNLLTTEGGDINIVSVASEGEINNSEYSNTELGNIKITGDSMIAADTETNSNGGNVSIKANDLIMEFDDTCGNPCPGISSDTRGGSGKGGNVNIELSGKLKIDGKGGISTASSGKSTGNSGNIYLSVGKLSLQNKGYINSGSSTSGNSGNINVYAVDDIKLKNRASMVSFSFNKRGKSGKSGDIEIFTNNLELKNSSITSFSINMMSSDVNGGDININAYNNLYMKDSGIITSAISLMSQQLGNGGNINISNPKFFIFGNSQILATAMKGKGGNINIIADNFIHSYPYKEGGEFTFALPYILKIVLNYNKFDEINFDISRINASSKFDSNLDGKITIDAFEKDFTGDLKPQSGEFQGLEISLSRCGSFDDLGSFIITARDISPPGPTALKY